MMDIEDEMQSHGLEVSDVSDTSDGSADLSDEDSDFDLDALEVTPVKEVGDKNGYKIVKEADIRQCQEEDITRLSTLLSVPRASAIILLLYYKWKLDAVQEAWFADEEKVRKAVGLFANPVVQIDDDTNLTCDICLETCSRDRMDAASCGHLSCIECLKLYVSKSIRGGPGGVMLHCPDVSCNAVIGQDMIDRLACEEDKAKYSHDLVRSYLEGSRTAKWCPSPGCDCAIVFGIDSNVSNNYNVNCTCSYNFCWNCSEEYHWPVDCDTVANWVWKNNYESVGTKWPLDKTKTCPHCSKKIEKDMGCMQIICPDCRMSSEHHLQYRFCWYCLGPLSDDHNHQCNSYTGGRVRGYVNLIERESKRHFHYYQRWLANHSSRLKALEALHKMVTEVFEELLDKQHITDESELDFVTEAWQEIALCRRVLKWSYAYGYYIPEDQIMKKSSFEYFQGQAESILERLHQYAENEIQPCLNAEHPSMYLYVIRDKVIQLTAATRTAFAILVKALENGVSDIISHWSCEHCTFTNVESSIDCEVCSLPRSGCL